MSNPEKWRRFKELPQDLRRATAVLRFEIMSTGQWFFADDDPIQIDMELS